MSDKSGVQVRFDERAVVKLAAAKRNAHFESRPTNRPLGKNYEEVGMWGEWEFGKWSGLMPRMSTVGGDGGYDFVLPLYLKVDVKTSRRGDYLLVEAGKVRADIYVLAKYEEETEWTGDKETTQFPKISLVGWATRDELLSVQPKDSGRGVVNHALRSGHLRPMSSLAAAMKPPLR